MRATRLLGTLRFIARHPLQRDRPLSALVRWARWQLVSRLSPGPIAVEFVSGTRLLVTAGMTGATGNIYVGLHELEPMAFVAHLLRPGDRFVDVGANVGSYTVLASAVAGATTTAFEPIAAAHARLVDNVRLNGIADRVEARREGVAAERGTLRFSTHLDTMNRVRTDLAAGEGAEVPVVALDQVLAPGVTAIKIDVEGYEEPVLRGATSTLRSPSLLAVVVETLGDQPDEGVQRLLTAAGFAPFAYGPFDRTLTSCAHATHSNTLYVRDRAEVARRLTEARPLRVLGRDI